MLEKSIWVSDRSEYKKTLRRPGFRPNPAERAYSAPENSLVGGEGLAVPSSRTPSSGLASSTPTPKLVPTPLAVIPIKVVDVVLVRCSWWRTISARVDSSCRRCCGLSTGEEVERCHLPVYRAVDSTAVDVLKVHAQFFVVAKVYSAFHPSGVGKWVLAAAGKAKAGMAHSDCGWTCWCAGETVKSLENTCHTWALLCDSLRRGAISSVCTFTFTFTLNAWANCCVTLGTRQNVLSVVPSRYFLARD